MGKISNEEIYIQDTDVSDLDSVIGTDGNTTAKTTKNFLMGKIKSYLKSGLSPLTGGTLRFTEISYTGGLYASVQAMVNALDPFFTIDQYHVVVVTLNGAKSILKLQDREVGLDKTPVVAGDFISIKDITSTPAIPTLDQILETGNTSDKDIILESSIHNTSTITPTEIVFHSIGTLNNFRVDTNSISYWDSTIGFDSSTTIKTPINPNKRVLFNTPLKNTGTYTLVTADEIIVYDGSETKINAGTNITVTGLGTTASPYVINTPTIPSTDNLQRDASVSFTVADSDNNYVIQLKNATDIVVTIPDTLTVAKFCCGFIRKGVGEVTFVGSGTMVLNNPIGFRINAQYDPAFIERDNAAQICTLLGNTKV